MNAVSAPQANPSQWVFHTGVVLASVGGALALRLALAGALGENAPLLIFVMAVIISGLQGGLIPGLVATLLGAVIGYFCFIVPFQPPGGVAFADKLRVVIFLAEGVAISVLSEHIHRVRRHVAGQAQKIAASEQRLSRILETNVDAIMIVNREGQLEFANPAAERLLRLNRSSIEGRAYNDASWAISGPDGEPFPEEQMAFARVAASNAPVTGVEHAIAFADGTRCILSINAAPLQDETGRFAGMVASLRDVTSEREREAERQALLAQERQARAAAEATLARLERLQNVTDAALGSLALDELLAALLARIRVALAVDTGAVLLRNTQNGTLEVQATVGLEEQVARGLSMKLNDGFAGAVAARRETLHIANREEAPFAGPAPATRELRSVLGTPLLVADSLIGVLHVGRLTTGGFNDEEIGLLELAAQRVAQAVYRAQQEQALRVAADRLAALHAIDQAILARTPLSEMVTGAIQRLGRLIGTPRAVALLDLRPAGAPVRLVVDPGENAAEAVGWEEQQLAGLFAGSPAPEQLVIAVERLCAVPLLAEPLCTGEVADAVVTPLCIDGGALAGALALGVPPGAGLAPDALALVDEVANQLTIALQHERLHYSVARHTAELEERVAERTLALETANAELEAFGYSVAHDLRAPIRAMQSFAAALSEDYGERLDALGQEYARRIVTAGERMEDLIDDLLAYSRLSRAELSFGPVALRQALDDACAQLAETVAERGATIEVVDPLPVVIGHRTTLAQMLANLLANAMTFVAPGTAPAIEVRAALRGSVARLEVSDNGIGIASEHYERIFRVFERLHSTEQYAGTGIGLAIVRKGVERMGGRAGVVSRPGHGSCFWIELPAAEDER